LDSAEDQQGDGEYKKPTITGAKVASKQLDNFRNDFYKKFPFEKGQY
jgi:hypothetical protein